LENIQSYGNGLRSRTRQLVMHWLQLGLKTATAMKLQLYHSTTILRPKTEDEEHVNLLS